MNYGNVLSHLLHLVTTYDRYTFVCDLTIAARVVSSIWALHRYLSANTLSLSRQVYRVFRLITTLFMMPLPVSTNQRHYVSLPFQTYEQDIFKKNAPMDFAENWHKWSTVQGDETINFGGQEVKGQGYTTPKLDLETWRRHHSWPVRSSRFQV